MSKMLKRARLYLRSIWNRLSLLARLARRVGIVAAEWLRESVEGFRRIATRLGQTHPTFRWLVLPVSIGLIPFLLSLIGRLPPPEPAILFPTEPGQILRRYASVVGSYYSGTFGLGFVVLYYVRGQRRRNSKVLGNHTTVVWLLMAAAFLLAFVHGQFQHLLGLQPNQAVFFENSADGNMGIYFQLGAILHRELTLNVVVHAMLGFVFGIICLLAYVTGSRLKLPKEVVDITPHFISVTSLITVVVAIMIFTLQRSELFGSIRHVLAVSGLLVGTISIAFGVLVSNGGSRSEPFATVTGGMISFVLGFILGVLILPFTRVPIILDGNPIMVGSSVLFHVFTGTYVFMCMTVTSSAVIATVASDPESPIYRILLGMAGPPSENSKAAGLVQG